MTPVTPVSSVGGRILWTTASWLLVGWSHSRYRSGLRIGRLSPQRAHLPLGGRPAHGVLHPPRPLPPAWCRGRPRLQAAGPGSARAGAAWPRLSLPCGDCAASWGCGAPCPRGAPLWRALSGGRPRAPGWPASVEGAQPSAFWAFLVLRLPLQPEPPGWRGIFASGFSCSFFQ